MGRGLPRWIGLLALCAVVAMVPWMVYLGLTLPRRVRTDHYDIAWIGFDVALWAVLGALAVAALRRHPAVGTVAAIAATLLVVDAWFDVTTSRGGDLLVSVLLAVFAELPMAVVCGWTAVHSERLRQGAYRTVYGRWRRAERALREVNADRPEVNPPARPR